MKTPKGGNQNSYIEEKQTTQWLKEKVQKDKQRSTKHTYKTNDRVTLIKVLEGGAKIFGVFRVKNHDFTPKNHIFPMAEGGAKIFGVFRVKNHDFTPKND
jgi:hypothetical protein